MQRSLSMTQGQMQQACDSCRLKKMKCSKDSPTCLKCKEHNWKCVYSPRAIRSPLTRAYLTQIENKAINLEKILKKILPEDVEISELLQVAEEQGNLDSFGSPGSNSTNEDIDGINQLFYKQINLTSNDLSKIPITMKNINQISQKKANDETLNPKKNNLEYQPEDYLVNIKESDLNYFDERDDFNNNSENVYDSSIDGMAALSNDTGLKFDVNSSNGYFGINSSNGLLKFLQLKQERNGNSIMELNLSSKDAVNDLGVNDYENDYALDSQLENIFKNGKAEDLLDNIEFQSLMVDSFFNRYYQVYPIINKKRFLKNYVKYKNYSDLNFNNERKLTFLVLLNTILAIGVWCKFGENSKVHTYYYQRVKYYTQQLNIFEYSDTQLLDSFVLLSNYVQKTNKPNTGWNYLGLSTRIATTLGLHKEVKIDDTSSNNLELFEDVEIRKRQWWGMYFFDVGTTLTFGRPLTIPPLSTIDQGPVSNIDDNLLRAGLPAEKCKVEYPTIYTTLIYESELTKISTRIYNYNSTVLKLSNDKSKMIGLLDINELLDNFIKKLPSYYDENEQVARTELMNQWVNTGYNNDDKVPSWFSLSRLRLICRYKNLQILIFRYILWESFESIKDSTYLNLVKRCRQICYDASLKTVIIVDSFIKNNELDYLSSWYATYFLFQAILIPILKLTIDQTMSPSERNQPNDPYSENELHQFVNTAKNAFMKLKSHNKLAGKFIKLIDLLLNNKKDNHLVPSNWNDLSKPNFDLFNNFDDIFDSDFMNIGANM